MPNAALVLVLLLGAAAVGRGALTLGTLVAFITLMLQLVWPVAALGVILAMAQEAMTAADRVCELLDTKPSVVGGNRVLEQPRGHLRLEGVGFRFPTPTSTCCTTSTSRCCRERPSRSSVRPARARRC
jgi:ATP-binding cassette subfamily B protein